MLLSDLQETFEAVASLGYKEATARVGNLSVTLRTMTSTEEVEVQKYAARALEGEEEELTTLEFMDRFRQATLGFAIVEIGGKDLRGVQSLDTGDKTSSGMPITVLKEQAVRQMVSKWGRSVQVALWEVVYDITLQAEAEMEQSLKANLYNLDAEIERLEAQIGALKEERDRRGGEKRNLFATIMDTVHIQNKVSSEAAKAPEGGQLPQPPVDNPEPPTQARQPVYPTVAPPPSPAPTSVNATPPQAPLHIPPTDAVVSSFIDPEDSATIQAENDRLIREYQQRQRQAQGASQAPSKPLELDSTPKGSANPRFQRK